MALSWGTVNLALAALDDMKRKAEAMTPIERQYYVSLEDIAAARAEILINAKGKP